MKKIIQQGAEAQILLDKNIIKKRRIRKSYRFLQLDEKIRKQRTKREAKLLEKVSTLIPTPKIFKTDNGKKEIDMEYIKGKKLSEQLDCLANKFQIAKQIGKQIALLHDNEIIHGDLTTSNMILKSSTLYFIDFGLSFVSSRIEDKAVDLHLIKQALEAKHFENYKKFFKAVLQGYKTSKNYKETTKRLEKVEKRGRYKLQY